MTDMQCLFQVSSSKLLMGGHQDKLIDLDLTKMTETAIVSNAYNFNVEPIILIIINFTKLQSKLEFDDSKRYLSDT